MAQVILLQPPQHHAVGPSSLCRGHLRLRRPIAPNRRSRYSWPRARQTDMPMATAMAMMPPDAAMKAPLGEDVRRIGVVVITTRRTPADSRSDIRTSLNQGGGSELRLKSEPPW